MAKKKGVTRRRFLEQVGLAGGSAALYETMTALGLINLPEAWAGPPELPQGSGTGKSVVILGAGIAGLTAAYELTRANYDCKIIELTERAGGRNHTARRGTVLKEVNEDGVVTEQVCNFDEGLYLNLGPGRLPYHHRRALHYCKELDVPLEVYVMETMANLFQSDEAFGGKAQIKRRIANDMQGYIAEMLAKAVNQNALNAELDAADRDNLLCLLKNFGDLGQNDLCNKCGQNRCNKCNSSCDACISCSKQCVTCFKYTGSTRDGCDITVHNPANLGPTLAAEGTAQFGILALSAFTSRLNTNGSRRFFSRWAAWTRSSMALCNKIGSLIQYNTKVLNIQISNDGVSVVIEARGSAQHHQRGLLHQQHSAAAAQEDRQQLRAGFRRGRQAVQI